MEVEEMLKHLSYKGCDCPIDRRENVGIINGFCPIHRGGLLFDGIPIETYKKLLAQREVDK